MQKRQRPLSEWGEKMEEALTCAQWPPIRSNAFCFCS